MKTTNLVRKMDPESGAARDLNELDFMKLVTIITLDNLKTETSIRCAATFIHALAEGEVSMSTGDT